jgi:hypothetical protein
MTKKYIVPCIIEVFDPAGDWIRGYLRTYIGPWIFSRERFPDTVPILERIGVEVNFDKMEQIAKQNGEKFDEDKFLKDFTDTVREALNEIVKGESK